MTQIIIPEPNYQEFKLPSNGLWNNIDVLHVRPLTLKDERLFLNKTLVRKNQVFDKIFQNVVKENVDFSDMFVADQTALIIFLRAISYGPEFEFSISCPYCSTKHSFKVNLEELPVKYYEGTEDFKIVTLPLSKKKVKVRFPRRRDVATEDVYTVLKKLVVEAEGIDPNALSLWLENLVAGDVAEIRNALLEQDFGVDTTFTFVCSNPNCDSNGEEIVTDLPIASPEFFRLQTNRTF